MDHQTANHHRRPAYRFKNTGHTRLPAKDCIATYDSISAGRCDICHISLPLGVNYSDTKTVYSCNNDRCLNLARLVQDRRDAVQRNESSRMMTVLVDDKPPVESTPKVIRLSTASNSNDSPNDFEPYYGDEYEEPAPSSSNNTGGQSSTAVSSYYKVSMCINDINNLKAFNKSMYAKVQHLFESTDVKVRIPSHLINKLNNRQKWERDNYDDRLVWITTTIDSMRAQLAVAAPRFNHIYVMMKKRDYQEMIDVIADHVDIRIQGDYSLSE